MLRVLPILSAFLLVACSPGVPTDVSSTPVPTQVTPIAVPTLQIGPVSPLPDPNTVPVPDPDSCHIVDDLPDHSCTPGALNPAIQIVNGQLIATLPGGATVPFCSRQFTTRDYRPPVSYTNRLKIRLMLSYGLRHNPPQPGDLSPTQVELDHLDALEDLGHPWSPLNLWPEPRRSTGATSSAEDKDVIETQAHTKICADQTHAFDYAAQLAYDWRALRRSIPLTQQPSEKEPEP